MNRTEALAQYAKDKNLSWANLSWADIAGADLNGANLTDAILPKGFIRTDEG